MTGNLHLAASVDEFLASRLFSLVCLPKKSSIRTYHSSNYYYEVFDIISPPNPRKVRAEIPIRTLKLITPFQVRN